MHKKDCPFCGREKITTDVVYEDGSVMAFWDMDPINEGHILLVPKDHYADADDMPDGLFSHLMTISRKIIYALKAVYRPDGYSVMQNGGRFNDAGHYHLHIFPRYIGDGFGWTCGKESKIADSVMSEKIRKLIG